MNENKVIHFVHKELGLSSQSIDLALRRQKQERGPLPMVLFELGLINVQQLNSILESTWTA